MVVDVLGGEGELGLASVEKVVKRLLGTLPLILCKVGKGCADVTIEGLPDGRLRVES